MSETLDKKRIAKNTILLYFRMLLTMIISLYTSRVVLNQLGQTDFGIYSVVGGVVGLLAFLNGALASGTNRFLAYELGKGDKKKMKLNFNSILLIHICLALFIALLLETVGMWILHSKLTIPADRMEVAVIVFHLSVITSIFTITQVPYTAAVMSHERMSVYAYMSIIEVTLKLSIAFALIYSTWDKLLFYAILMLIVQVGVAVTYRIYCIRKFEETHFSFTWDKNIVRNVLSYSFWNLLTNITLALKNQGVVVLISMFFNPHVVTARTVANQVNMAALQFASNFQSASNPQIIKSYAAGNVNGSRLLTIETAKYCYFMMLALCIPILFVAKPLLQLWLGQVPEYADIFLQLTILSSLVTSMSNSFYTALCAVGKLRLNSVLCALVSILVIPIGYVAYKFGASPYWIGIIILIDDFIISFIVKPYVLVKDAKFLWSDMFVVFKSCIIVSFVAVIAPSFLAILFKDFEIPSMMGHVILVAVSVLSVITTVWFIGLDKRMRNKFVEIINKKLNRNGL